MAIGLAAAIRHLEFGASEHLRQLQLLGVHLGALKEALLDCETNLRGYLITSDERFLLTQRVGCRAAVDSQLAKIRELDQLLAKSLEARELDRAVEALLSDIDTARIAIGAGRRDDVVAKPAMERSRDAMEAARRSIAGFLDENGKVTAQTYARQQYLHVFETSTLVVIVGFAGIFFARAQRSERRLSERLELERAIWKSAADGLFLFDTESQKIIDVNQRGCVLLGLPEETIIGEPWMRFMPSHEMARAQAHVSAIGQEPQILVQGNLLAADGREIPVEASISAEIAMNGRRLAVSAFRNLTEREQALREAVFRKAVEETMPSGLAAVSDKGQQTYVNNRLCDLLGWSREELVGKQPPFVYWPPEEANRIQAVFQDAIEGRVGPAGAEITLMKRSGERFPAQILVARVAYDREPGWLAFVIDLSERRRSEAALEEARRLESIGQLAGQVAHDFNNLLTIVAMNTAMLRQVHAADATIAEPLADIADAAKRGTNITKTLLAVARRQSLAPEPVELVSQLKELKSLFVATCGPSIAVIVDAPPTPVWMDVDPGGLSGSLLNLVINARDAMPGGGSVRIRVGYLAVPHRHSPHGAVLKPGSYCIIEVSDTGHGMPPEVRRRAFEPFFTTKGRVGMGLGLAAVYGFARQSDGLAEIESEAGQGTTVRLYIPTIKAPAQAPAGTAITSTSLGAFRVLLVDDEPDLLKALAAALRHAGHTVALANDGATALEILAAQEFDILLSDIVMSGMAGTTLAEHAARLYPRLSIALMTGFGMRPPEEELPWETIEKPFTSEAIADLFARIRSKTESALERSMENGRA